MDYSAEALQIWKYLEPMVKETIRREMGPVVRRKNFIVASAPNGTTLGVKEPGSDAVVRIPYVSTLSGLAVGDPVQCEWTYNMTNLIAVARGSGL